MTTINLTPLPYVTPSQVARLLNCPLQAGFDRDRSLQKKVVPSPATFLGTICHRVLEAVGSGAIIASDVWDSSFTILWSREVELVSATIALTPYAEIIGEPQRWPYYATRRAWCKQRAYELCQLRNISRLSPSMVSMPPMFEQSYVAFAGRMRGVADVVRQIDNEVIIEDYKTGAVASLDEETLEMRVREQYRQQVLLYAAMHHDTTGIWPSRARLIPMEGEPVEIDVVPSEALQLAAAALEALDAYNAFINMQRPSEELARPNEETCQWCAYQGLCDQVWEAMSSNWAWSRHSVEGVVRNVVNKGRGMIDVDLYISRGTLPEGLYRIRSDNTACNKLLQQAIGSCVRITHLRAYPHHLTISTTSGVWLTSPSTHDL